MVVWYLNHYASPPGKGLPGRPYFLAKSMSELGHEVINICASAHHLRSEIAPSDELERVIKIQGVNYFQVVTRPYQGNGYGRLMNMLDYARQVKQLNRAVRDGCLPKPDVLVPSCVHLFSFNPAYALAKEFSAKIIFEVRDIWPLSLVELAGVPRWHPLILWMSYLERCAYRQCDAVVSLLPSALDHMVSRGMNEGKFHYIPNGISLEEWEGDGDPLPELHHALFSKLKSQGKLIVLYAGAHGPPNALDQILDLKKINNNEDVPYHFVLIGDGVEKENLIRRSIQENLSFVSFLPKLKKSQVISAIRSSDVCFISLKEAPVFRFGVSPNKLGDYLISGRPVIYSIIAGNDPVAEANAGISVRPYDVFKLDSALRRFYDMPISEREKLGLNGREFALKNLDWKILGKKYADICNSLL